MPYFIFLLTCPSPLAVFFYQSLFFRVYRCDCFCAVLSLTTASFRHMLQFSIRADDTPRLEIIGTSSPVAAKLASVLIRVSLVGLEKFPMNAERAWF